MVNCTTIFRYNQQSGAVTSALQATHPSPRVVCKHRLDGPVSAGIRPDRLPRVRIAVYYQRARPNEEGPVTAKAQRTTSRPTRTCKAAQDCHGSSSSTARGQQLKDRVQGGAAPSHVEAIQGLCVESQDSFALPGGWLPYSDRLVSRTRTELLRRPYHFIYLHHPHTGHTCHPHGHVCGLHFDTYIMISTHKPTHMPPTSSHGWGRRVSEEAGRLLFQLRASHASACP